MRRPLKPLARIIAARDEGIDPNLAEAEARLAAARSKRRAQHVRAQVRLLMVCALFCLGYGAVAARMVLIASGDVETRVAGDARRPIVSDRADILDRNGKLLATNVATHSVYVQTDRLLEPERAAAALAEIFPDLDAKGLLKRFQPPTKFAWIKRRVSPEQAQRVHDIGDPGILLGSRSTRLYPNGQMAAHVLGGAGWGREDVNGAEVVGRDGIERWFDQRLREDAAVPLQLSLDLTVQAAIRSVLQGGMKLMNAKGASAILMDSSTGEILSLVSLPDFDPNYRPHNPTSGDPADSPLFNRAAQGRYELGSTYKLFTAAIAIENGYATPDTLVDTSPLKWGRYRIREFNNRDLGPFLPLTKVLTKSSNVGSARLAMEFGTEAQKRMLADLGMLEPVPVELSAARSAQPLYPKRWSEISTITISYGHGLSATPLHIAAAYASLLNGGIKVAPTLVKQGLTLPDSIRVVSQRTSDRLRYMLRKVVTEGSATMADIPGYHVMGKTGTAEKPKNSGGYHDDKVIANFAAAFPADNPKYVLVVTLDEPEDYRDGKKVRSAGWTAVPVAGEIIRRSAPLLGLRPDYRGLNAETDKAEVTLAVQ